MNDYFQQKYTGLFNHTRVFLRIFPSKAYIPGLLNMIFISFWPE